MYFAIFTQNCFTKSAFSLDMRKLYENKNLFSLYIEMKNKYLGWFVIVIVINILLFSIVFFVNRTSESFESSDVLLVVSRYNENLEWLKEDYPKSGYYKLSTLRNI